MCFRMKQVFERILDEHPTTPTFKDYHTVCSFTGTIHSERKKRAAALASAIATATTPPAPAPAAPAQTVATSGKAKASKAVSTSLFIVLSFSDRLFRPLACQTKPSSC